MTSRREFIRRIALAAGAVVAAPFIPASVPVAPIAPIAAVAEPLTATEVSMMYSGAYQAYFDRTLLESVVKQFTLDHAMAVDAPLRRLAMPKFR